MSLSAIQKLQRLYHLSPLRRLGKTPGLSQHCFVLSRLYVHPQRSLSTASCQCYCIECRKTLCAVHSGFKIRTIRTRTSLGIVVSKLLRSSSPCSRSLRRTTRVLRTHGCSSYEYSSMGGGRLAMSPDPESLLTGGTLWHALLPTSPLNRGTERPVA